MDTKELIKEVDKWKEYVESQIKELSNKFKHKFRPLVEKDLQKLANETGLQLVVNCSMGVSLIYAIDVKNNIKYISGYDQNGNPCVDVKPYDKLKGFDYPSDLSLKNITKKLHYLFVVGSIMDEAWRTQGMTPINLDVKPDLWYSCE